MIIPDASTRLKQSQIMLWTRGCLLTGGLAFLGAVWMLLLIHRSHQLPPLEIEPSRINPNTASMASLVRLPGIGKARAMDIIHYRQNHESDGAAFLSSDDLQNIHGIGPKTVAALEPWLAFETESTGKSLDNGRLGN
jgi:hypothetical protein